MKIFDLLRIATKNLKTTWVVLPIIGIATSVFCFCFAGAVLTTVQEEESLHCEILVSTVGTKSFSDSNLAEISKLLDVKAVTPLLKVPTNIKTGKYYANMILIGVKASYITDKFAEGKIFEANSLMPYIVLNKAACKQFSDEPENTSTDTEANTGDAKTDSADKGNTSTDTKPNTGNAKTDSGSKVNTSSQASSNTKAPDLKWLKASFSLQPGEDGRLFTSKICGILDGDDDAQDPVAYISLSSAKDLLQKSGQSTDYVEARVRIKNMKCTDSVTGAIEKLGFTVTKPNVLLQAKWEAKLKEMVYLMVIGAFSLLYSVVLMASSRKIAVLQQKEAWEMLRWVGMKEKDMSRLFVIEALIISLIGIVIGLIVSTSLPAFLPSFLAPSLSQDNKEPSVFTLLIPYLVLVLSSVICIVVVMLSMLNIKKQNYF
ncbi:MAG: FtsX-like permease family protein [Clostridiaceae bacterium]|nr:FtsX-like permease family protein [Clostridiaceae bacterium]